MLSAINSHAISINSIVQGDKKYKLIKIKDSKKYKIKKQNNKIKDYDLIVKAKNGDEKALEKLLENYKGLINKIVNNYYHNKKMQEIDYEDLFAEGQIGFLEALKKFDEGKGCQLTTYATYNIQNAILNALRKGSLIKHSTVAIAKKIKENKTNKENLNKDTKLFEITYYENSSDIEIDYNYISEKVNYDNEVEKLYIKKEEYKNLYKALGQLSEKEKQVIYMYFGLNSEKKKMQEIANLLLIEKKDVIKIKTNALKKLRNIMKNN